MKRIALITAFSACSLLAACGGSLGTNPPTATQVSIIEGACAQDQLIRPIVQVAAAVKATPAESALLTANEKLIDQVCANPTATPEANIQASFNQAIKDIAALEGTWLAREAAEHEK